MPDETPEPVTVETVPTNAPFQFSLRVLLLGVMVVATFIGMYGHVWRLNHRLPALYTTIVAAAVCIVIQRKRQRNELLGAIVGGAFGGIVSIALDKICCDVILPGVYEHEGLGLVQFTLVFSPLGAFCGMIVGACTWGFAWFFAFLRKLDAQSEI